MIFQTYKIIQSLIQCLNLLTEVLQTFDYHQVQTV